MSGYSKLFNSIWEGSLWGKFEASAVFMLMLSLSDPRGFVDMTPEHIAARTGWPFDFIMKGIRQLMQPDKKSRTQTLDGRRIVPIDSHRDWGWKIVNYEKYRDLLRTDARREYFREYKRAERAASRSEDHTPDEEAPQPKEKTNGTRLDKPFVIPDTWVRWAQENRPDLDAQHTAQCFADYWHGLPGAKGRKLDWFATWRNWCRKEPKKTKAVQQSQFGVNKSAAIEAENKRVASAMREAIRGRKGSAS